MFEINPKLDIASSQIAEFENDINKVLTYRKLPTEHFSIKFAHRYSPFNHPAVMMRKASIIKQVDIKIGLAMKTIIYGLE